jgi:hypothetical protein
MTQQEVAALVAKARRTNRERDEIDRGAGFAAPGSGPVYLQVRTVMSALDAAMREESWDAVAEGYAMAEEVDRRLRGAAA